MSWLKERKYRSEADSRIRSLAVLVTRTRTGETLWEMDPQGRFSTAGVYGGAPGRWTLEIWLKDDGSPDMPRLEFIPEGCTACAVAIPDCTPASTPREKELLRALHGAVGFWTDSAWTDDHGRG
jgi:hypothetical protein